MPQEEDEFYLASVHVLFSTSDHVVALLHVRLYARFLKKQKETPLRISHSLPEKNKNKNVKANFHVEIHRRVLKQTYKPYSGIWYL